MVYNILHKGSFLFLPEQAKLIRSQRLNAEMLKTVAHAINLKYQNTSGKQQSHYLEKDKKQWTKTLPEPGSLPTSVIKTETTQS